MFGILLKLPEFLQNLPFKQGSVGNTALFEQPKHKAPIDVNRKLKRRLGFAILVYSTVICAIFGRLVQFSIEKPASEDAIPASVAETSVLMRPQILDRNGEVLATDVKVASLFAEPKRMIDPDEAAELIAATLPNINARELQEKFTSKKGFVWVQRGLSPQQRAAVHALGIPGIGFIEENSRQYPSENLASHVLGTVNTDNQGISGIEKYVDMQGLSEQVKLSELPYKRLNPIKLSIDLRVQHAVRDEMIKAVEKYHAIASAGVMVNVHTGEIVSMVSLPDFNPKHPKEALQPDRINRVLTGTFEMGSTFKSFTSAMALDSGKFTLSDRVDARSDLRFGKYTIGDFHGQYRVLTLPEVFTYSSNIGTAKMALAHSLDEHKNFLKRLGLMDRVRTELPESADPIVPKQWSPITSATVAFGHGITVTPIQASMAASALMNGGKLLKPTILTRSVQEADLSATQVIRPETSEAMRYLYRLNVERGTAKRAEAEGYNVGGKTGTAEKVVHGRYSKDKRFTTFFASFPVDKPEYVLIIVLDEPKAEDSLGAHGPATAGLNVAPMAGQIIARAAPLLGMQPRFTAIANVNNDPTSHVGSVAQKSAILNTNSKQDSGQKMLSSPQLKDKAKTAKTPVIAQTQTGPTSLDDLIKSVPRR